MDTLSPANPNGQKQHLALRVALDTMKDRCILQQKRLTEIEEENNELRERLTQHKPTNATTQHNSGGVAENFQLRLQVSELQRQNDQLNAHISMVSSENRKLWSRLSQIAKDQSSKLKDNDCTLTASDIDAVGDGSPRGGLSSQNLIRSKTFSISQHSPNPNLRHKVIPAENCEPDMLLRDVSLEDGVALEVYGDGERINKQQLANDEVVSEVAMGFGYLNVDDTSASSSSQEQDFNAETKKCIEGLGVMRREAMKQQKELNSVFALLESRIALQPCPECVKKSHKPEMADKSLETDESFNDSKYTNSNHNRDLNNVLESPSKATSMSTTPPAQANNLKKLQEKYLADQDGKICPMCGKLYGTAVSFETFCEHVEEHFRDESIDLAHSMENNFEFISHAVGDF